MLKDIIFTERESIEQMKTLRKKLPFSSALKALETYESFGDKLCMWHYLAMLGDKAIIRI